MDMDSAIKLIQGVGFPIAVAAFVLVRMENTIKSLTDQITKLTSSVDALELKIGNKGA